MLINNMYIILIIAKIIKLLMFSLTHNIFLIFCKILIWNIWNVIRMSFTRLFFFPLSFFMIIVFFFVLKYNLCPSSIVCSTNPTNYIGKYIPISKNIIKGSL